MGEDPLQDLYSTTTSQILGISSSLEKNVFTQDNVSLKHKWSTACVKWCFTELEPSVQSSSPRWQQETLLYVQRCWILLQLADSQFMDNTSGLQISHTSHIISFQHGPYRWFSQIISLEGHGGGKNTEICSTWRKIIWNYFNFTTSSQQFLFFHFPKPETRWLFIHL